MNWIQKLAGLIFADAVAKDVKNAREKKRAEEEGGKGITASSKAETIYVSRKHRLIDKETGKTYGLTALGVTSFGREADNTHVFSDDPSISRHHFEILCTSGGYELYVSPKKGKKNPGGTQNILDIKGADDSHYLPVEGRHLLRHGDSIRAGGRIFVYSSEEIV